MVVLGIDLGKTTCSVAVLPNDGDDAFVFHEDPIVALSVRDGWVVGAKARRIAVNGGGEAVWDLLELQGRKETDFSAAQLASWTFHIVRGAAGKALVELQAQPLSGVDQKIYPPEELLAMLFVHVRCRAEQHIGTAIKDVVLTIPACCSYAQRQALRDAGAMAGLRVQRTVVSSTAAAIAFGSTRGKTIASSVDQLLLVVDLGAGCVDTSLVSVRGATKFEVKAVAGDASLGGVVLTDRIAGHFVHITSIQAAYANAKNRHRLRRASQFAKHFLTSSDAASVQVQLDSGSFAGSISRAHFELLCSDCWDRIRALIRLVLEEGNSMVDHVEGVVLCGGSAVVPAVQKTIQNLFPERTTLVMATEALQARGAAILAASLVAQSPTIELMDVLPLGLGVQRVGTRDVTIVAPANILVPFHRESLLFASSQHADIVYRVLESRHVRQLVPSTSGRPNAAQCIGTLRLPKAPLGAATPLVTKLQIGIDVDTDRQLSATITDLTTRQSDHMAFTGDDATLPRTIVARMQQQLEQRFGPSAVPSVSFSADPVSVCSARFEPGSNRTSGSYPAALETLQQYASDLKAMITAEKIEIPISDEDKNNLSRKVDETLGWLEQTTADNTSNAHNENLANQLPDIIDYDACVTRLQSLRRLHLSAAASEAITRLRRLDG